LTFPTPRLHVSGIRTCLGKELDQRAIYATLMVRLIRKVLSYGIRLKSFEASCRLRPPMVVGQIPYGPALIE
jgi:hypothetical protein